MLLCQDCKVFKPNLFSCPTANMLVEADTNATMCSMKVSRCGDCMMFMPHLFNCPDAKWGDKPAPLQVSPFSTACSAFMSK